MRGEATSCPECGAGWRDGLICRACAEQMQVWDFENWDVAGEVHDLSGLCYHIQHPSLYSPEALTEAISLLADYVEWDIQPAAAMRRSQDRYRSRTWSWKPRDAPASYDHPIPWTMTAPDVVRGGFIGYPARVRAWAHSIYHALRTSPNEPDYRPSAAAP
jgi:hypothetical protein